MLRRTDTPETAWIKRLEVRFRWLSALAVAVSCMNAAPAASQLTAVPELRQAIEAYDAGELQRALALLQAAPALLDPHESAVRNLYTGLVQFALGESAAARLAFMRAVRTEPGIELDPAIHSPARVAAFQEAKSDVVAELRASAVEADGRGEAITALERWNLVLLAVPRDMDATRRVAEINRERLRQAADSAATASDSVIAAPPVAVPAVESQPVTTVDRRFNPGQAFAMGLLVPGLGQFYTGKAGRGAIALGAAGGVIAVGLLSERLEIECGSVPVNDVCPSGDVLDERTRRPYLAPALAAAAGIALVGAIDAMITARRSNAGASPAGQDGGDRPSLHVLAPSFSSANGVFRADLLRIRFR